MNSYTVAFNGQQFGPRTQEEIAALLAAGQIDQTALVWQEGWADWAPVSTIMLAAVPPRAAPAAQGLPYSTPMPHQFPGSGQPVYGGVDHSGKAVAGMVLGIIGMIFWCFPILGLPVNIIGLVLSIIGRKSSKRGMAIAGIILSSIGLALSIINSCAGAYLGAQGKLGKPF